MVADGVVERVAPADAVREALVWTRWTIVDLEPGSLERVAAFLDALVSREPLKSGKGYANERIVLGCLVTDLRSMVMAAGEPVGAQRDLRDAQTKSDERAARQRADLVERHYHDLITDAIEEDQRRLPPVEEITQDPVPVTPVAVASDAELPAWA